MKVTNLPRMVAPNAQQKIIDMRAGKKLREQMISFEDAPYAYAYSEVLNILLYINVWFNYALRIKHGKKVVEKFGYNNDQNPDWMSDAQLQAWIDHNQVMVGDL